MSPDVTPFFAADLLTHVSDLPVQLSYQLEDHLCHYIRSNGVTVMVMADQELARRVAFGFLNELLKRVGMRSTWWHPALTELISHSTSLTWTPCRDLFL